MTKRSLILLGVTLGGLAGWIGFYFAYFNWFQEEETSISRTLVGVGMWASGLVGLVALIGLGFSIWRTPRA